MWLLSVGLQEILNIHICALYSHLKEINKPHLHVSVEHNRTNKHSSFIYSQTGSRISKIPWKTMQQSVSLHPFDRDVPTAGPVLTGDQMCPSDVADLICHRLLRWSIFHLPLSCSWIFQKLWWWEDEYSWNTCCLYSEYNPTSGHHVTLWNQMCCPAIHKSTFHFNTNTVNLVSTWLLHGPWNRIHEQEAQHVRKWSSSYDCSLFTLQPLHFMGIYFSKAQNRTWRQSAMYRKLRNKLNSLSKINK